MSKIEQAVNLTREVSSWARIQSELEHIETNLMSDSEIDKLIDRVFKIQTNLHSQIEELKK